MLSGIDIVVTGGSVFNPFTIDLHIATPRRQEDLLSRRKCDRLLRRDDAQHLLGDDFNLVALRLDLDLAFGRHGFNPQGLGKQVDAFADTGDEAFAHTEG